MKTVFLIGDSIRVGSRTGHGYGPAVARKLAEKARVLQPEDNCRFTTYTIRHMRDWFKGLKPDEVDIIHWNNGLWDVALLDGDEEPLIPPAEYAHNLVRVFRHIRSFFPQAKVVFAYSTPILEKAYKGSFLRTNADIRSYNQIAREVLEPLGVTFDDLYSVAEEFPESMYSDHKTHFSDEASEILADAVIASLPLEEV